MSEVKYKLVAGTNVGLVRTNNEDNFVVCPDLTTSDWRIPQVSNYADLGKFGALLVVADGMGGMNAGEVASAICVETIQNSFTPERLQHIVKDDKAIQEFMKEVVKAADQSIFNRSSFDSTTKGMGTTVVMAWILGKCVYVCWCGDSRCYMLNRRKGLVRLSKDHSYVQELIDRGELEPQYAMDHPLSNVITRCLGDEDNRAVPDSRIFQLHDGDTILLCSDGLSGLCSDEQILDLLINYRENIDECLENLISAALGEGGTDNVTVALCNIQIEGDKEEPLPEEDTEDKGLGVAKQNTDSSDEGLSETLAGNARHKKNNFLSMLWRVLFVFIVAVIVFLIVRSLGDKKADKLDVIPADSVVETKVVPATPVKDMTNKDSLPMDVAKEAILSENETQSKDASTPLDSSKSILENNN